MNLIDKVRDLLAKSIANQSLDKDLKIVSTLSVWSNGRAIRRYQGQDESTIKHSVSKDYRKMVAILIEVEEGEI